MTSPAWRLGAPSFVLPAGWLDNVRYLAPLVQDVEILFFEVDGPDALPDATELAGLYACKQMHQLTYSVHTPLAASLASTSPARRAQGVAQVLRAITAAAPLHPDAYVLHVYFGDCEGDTPPTDVVAWRRRAMASLVTIVQESGVPPERLCVETLDYDFSHLEPVLDKLGLSVALDVGHLWRDQIDVEPVLARNAQRIRIVQCHGTDNTGRDHRALSWCPPGALDHLLRRLEKMHYTGVFTVEVFRPDDLHASLPLLLNRSSLRPTLVASQVDS